MYCITWTYQTPPHFTKELIESQFIEVASKYIGVPGLIRKYFCYSADGKTVAGIYLWLSKTDADRFFTPEWHNEVTRRWGAAPVRSEWIVPVIAESVEEEVVTS